MNYQRNDIDLPEGDFVTNLVRTRVSYSFSPRVFTQALVQYNDRADLWSMNLRFGWLQAANTGLFIVYNDTRGLYDLFDRPERTDRSFTIKYSHMLRSVSPGKTVDSGFRLLIRRRILRTAPR